MQRQVDAAVVLDESGGSGTPKWGDRLSESTRREADPDTGPTACSTAQLTMFPFGGNGPASGVTLGMVQDLPPTDGAFFTYGTHVLSLHLGRPLSLRQRREDLSHAWTFTRGDLSLIPAGWRTTVWTHGPANFLQVELPTDLVRRAVGDPGNDVEMPCLFSFEDPLCRELSLSMLSEAQTNGRAARMYVESAAVVLAQRLMALRQRPRGPAPKPGLPPALLRRAKEFLHDEMTRNPGLTELSSAVGMNVDHFSRLFKRSTGVAPHQYLGNIRLERAKRLLIEGRTSIIDIAYEIGYANPSQFSAFFRKRTGLSPTEFRRNVQIKSGSDGPVTPARGAASVLRAR
jgi:AraC family transcriptional regulator